MMEDYVKDPKLKAIFLLADMRREPGEEDKAFLSYLLLTGIPVVGVLTKMDKMNQKERHEAMLRAGRLGLLNPLPSDLSSSSLDAIRKRIHDSL